MPELLFSVEHLCKEYKAGNRLSKKETKEAVRDVSFVIKESQAVGLVGETGSGKTTIAKCLDILERPSSGDIKFKGESIFQFNRKEMKHYRSQVQMVLQDPYASLDPQKTVEDLIREPLLIYHICPRRETEREVGKIMELVGLSANFKIRYPHELSGGQRQRVSIARALSIRPDVLIADEPVSALDVSTQAQILNLLKELKRELNLTLIFISHDLAVVKYICDYMIVLKDGVIVEKGETGKLFANPSSDYFVNLIQAVPKSSPYDSGQR